MRSLFPLSRIAAAWTVPALLCLSAGTFAQNQPPVVIMLAEGQPIAHGGDLLLPCEGATTDVQLDATQSFDPDGDPLTFLWAACPGSTLDDPTSPTPVLTIDTSASCTLVCGVRLHVGDGQTVTAARFFVHVEEPTNNPPVCDIKAPNTVVCKGYKTYVKLDGSGSFDPDGDPLTFLWTSCEDSKLSDPTSPTPTLTLETWKSCEFTCVVTLTVSDGTETSVCEKEIEVVPCKDCCKDKLRMLEFEYTGKDCSASKNSQYHAYCEGDPQGAAEVHIVVSSKYGSKIYFDGIVRLRESFEALASNAGQSKFEDEMRVKIYDLAGNLLQELKFSTSCYQDLKTGDTFGSLFLKDCGSQSVCEDGTLQALTVRYTGDSCYASSNSQDDDYCSGDPDEASPVRIIATDKYGYKVYFNGDVVLDGVFDIDALNAGKSYLDSWVRVKIYKNYGKTTCKLLQSVKFRTDCDEPLYLFDQFGSIEILGYRPKP
jgi:hypothetical protein